MEKKSEESKMELKKKVEEFLASEKEEYKFPTSLSSTERRLVHELAKEFNLTSLSVGEGSDRQIVVNKATPKKGSGLSAYTTKRFQKDFDLPLPLPFSPYFEYYVNAFPDLKIKEKLVLLEEIVEEANKNKQDLKLFIYDIKDKIVDAIKVTENYKQFTQKKALYDEKNLKFPQTVVPYDPKITSTKPRYFISMDIVKANFNSMFYFDPNLVFNCKTWSELVLKFTKFNYFVEAKYFRQVVFGNLNGKKCTQVQKHMMSKLASFIEKYNKENSSSPIELWGCASSDEMVIKSSQEKLKQDFLSCKEMLAKCGDELLASMIRVEPVRLTLLKPGFPAFAKEVVKDLDKDWNDKNNLEISFKGAPSFLFPQIYKFWHNLPLHINDLKLLVENQYVATMDVPLFERERPKEEK